MLTKKKKIILSLIIIAIIACFIIIVYSSSTKITNPYPMDQNYFLRKSAINVTINSTENEVITEDVEEQPVQEVEKVALKMERHRVPEQQVHQQLLRQYVHSDGGTYYIYRY